jgi:hypothetical protein
MLSLSSTRTSANGERTLKAFTIIRHDDFAWRMSAFVVAIGVKRTWACALHMSASDPKRTWPIGTLSGNPLHMSALTQADINPLRTRD